MDAVDDSFDKEDLFDLLQTENNEISDLRELIVKVEKSFPTAKTNFLQKAVTIYSKSDELVTKLEKCDKTFILVELLCMPRREDKLLYEPNDYCVGGFNLRKSHLRLINAPEAWDITKGDERILIGITDTHIEQTHEDLATQIDQVLQNAAADFHGVAVSGCAAAATDNFLGVAGIGFNSKIVFSSNWANTDEVLQMAQIPGVRVINCSWINHWNFSINQEMVYDEIRDVHNVIVTAGAGNEPYVNNALTDPVYPAAYSSVIAVAAVGHENPYGVGNNNWEDVHEEIPGDPTSAYHHYPEVNICAPSYKVMSPTLNNGYTPAWGTSFGAPMVAGVCALVASVNPCLSASEIQDIVLNSADASIYNIPENSAYIGLLGTGRVDAAAAVQLALNEGTEFIQNQNFSNTTTEESETIISAGNNVTNTIPSGNVNIQSGANVTFRATHKIVLSEGFKVSNNAVFKAEIYESNCF